MPRPAAPPLATSPCDDRLRENTDSGGDCTSVILESPTSRSVAPPIPWCSQPRPEPPEAIVGVQASVEAPPAVDDEAIGTLYGDEDDSGSEGGRPLSVGRPLSFIGGPSPYQEQLPRPPQDEQLLSVNTRRGLKRSETDPSGIDTMSVNGGHGTKPQPLSPNQRSNSFEQSPKSPLSPTLSLRDVQADPSGSQFPLTNIDNPNDIAQELSNLQALRRLSMDVGNNKDPDLPPMSLMAMPAIAPSGDDDENDPSRLLWVPARVHPELAPTEFKSFLENRVHSIRRRSGESFLSADSDVSQDDSASGGLRRKKSMLSRQIDNSGGRGAVGYVDGAERLERKRSRGHSHELSLEEFVKDPTKAVQKFAQESQVAPTGPESNADDMPILPAVPGMGLRRSTRTTYRKGGSLRSGGGFARRGHRNQPSESDSASSPLEAPKGFGLSRVQSEPLADNYSRQNRQVKRTHKFSQESLGDFDPDDGTMQETGDNNMSTATDTFQDQLPIRPSSNLPTIETSTHDDSPDQLPRPFPKRSSSQSTGSQPTSQAVPEPESSTEESHRSSRRSVGRQTASQSSQQQYTSRSSFPQGQSLNENLAANPSPLPGGGATRTDSLTFIPTLNQEERKPEKKSKKDRDDDSSSTKSSGSAWKWFKSGTDDKDKKKEESKKAKTKSVDKGQDNVRLDVIQTSIDKNASKGRESLVLDRDNVDSKLQEERKKESHRKSDSKRDKDGSIFSSIFGGSKKKEEKEKSSKKTQHLKVPEEPVYKPLVPDVDYHWTRFPLLEERAIYRMAHIKLANPRRSLLSQVLLSNFMYSYLAIVQAMHPQMNVPISPQQKRLEEEARRKQQEEEYMAQQRMQEEQDAQDAIDQYNFDYHRAAVQYAESGNEEVDYVDDAQIYEDEHGNDHHDGYDYEGSDGYGQGVKEYYQYHDNNGDDRRRDGREDMW
ncbi:SNF5-component of SWI SNF transcription activator complex [Fusarium albosuccineum]|uniref:SNF5-component of SWI SNF transcription activator complex n=1 Tax=Fusarium albosuccineum TaxID=1237068 RepID=A0A8H4P9E1_9HYPO|nr:SNF5-component of SWI SNF transcription activator complex [Fusarium albosuccineum]